MDRLVIGGELPKNQALVSELYYETWSPEYDRQYSISKGSFGYHICAITEYYVIKDSIEYDNITKIIEAPGFTSSIVEYLDTLAIEHMKPEQILKLIENIESKSYNKGKEFIQKQMRQVLGIN